MTAATVDPRSAGDGRGRSGSATRQRTVNLTVRLSPEERAALDEAARAAGMSAGSFIRWQLTQGEAPRSVRRPPLELEALRVLLGQLGKVGSNLNQIAHRANLDRPIPAVELTEALRDVRAIRDAALLALGYEVEP